MSKQIKSWTSKDPILSQVLSRLAKYSAAEKESSKTSFFALTSLEIVPNTCISCLYYKLPWKSCKNDDFSYLAWHHWKSLTSRTATWLLCTRTMSTIATLIWWIHQLFFAMLRANAYTHSAWHIELTQSRMMERVSSWLCTAKLTTQFLSLKW